MSRQQYRLFQYIWVMGVMLLALVLPVYSWWQSQPTGSEVHLGIEEREALVFLLQALEWEHPSEKGQIRTLRREIETGAVHITDFAPSSSEFFGLDPIAQKQVLLKLARRSATVKEEVARHF